MLYRNLRIILLAVIVCFAYSNSLDGQFVFDDSRIYNNPDIRISSLDLTSLKQAAIHSKPVTRPLANLSFALNYFFHGNDVRGYHLVNILIHLITGLFLYLLVIATLRAPAFYQRNTSAEGLSHEWLAFFIALLWMVHPVQTQAVTYIVQRMTSLAAMFYLSSLYFYVKGRLSQERLRGGIFFGASLLSGILALASKEVSVTLPFFVFIYEWYFLQDMDCGWLRRRSFLAATVLVFFIGSCLYFLGVHPVETILASYQSRDFTLQQRLLTELRVLFFYLSLLVFPLPSRLNLDHDFLVSTSLLQPPTTIVAAVGLLALVALAILTARRQRLLSFAIIWFLGNLVIESSFIALELVFEHRLYLPSMMLVALAVIWGDRLMRSHLWKTALLVGLVLVFSFWTFERNKVWSDRISLWSECVAKSPDKARPRNNLGVALKNIGRFEQAADQYKAVIKIDPYFVEAYNNLANVLMEMGQLDEALDYYYKALEIKPNHYVIHNNIGKLLMGKQQYDRAMMHFAEALRLKPDFAEARKNLRYVQLMWRNTSRTGRKGEK